MINQNKEEIEKMMRECRMPFDKNKHIQTALQERIKTSILWCEDEIEYLEELCSYAEDEDNMQLINTIEPKLEQLQIHLKWLKEQEQTE
jgi:hypothetical protein